MDLSLVVMILGFCLAGYSVVGNDVIQTLGTFLTSNEKRVKWQTLWAFAASIMIFTLVYGYFQGDVSYGRLEKYTLPDTYSWYFMIPPMALMLLTRLGIPVSTTFIILTLFALEEIPADFKDMVGQIVNTDTKLGGMIMKSLRGYLLAFGVGIVVYLLISNYTEKRFREHQLEENSTSHKVWIVLQWIVTGLLWYTWLIQDLANIYVYLGKGRNDLSLPLFALSCAVLLALLAYIFQQRGGRVQDVVRSKTNTEDIRSATFIALTYSFLLYYFKELNKIPMSTTWVFMGLLAGREIAMRIWHERKRMVDTLTMILQDLRKVFIGLVVSILVVFIIKVVKEQGQESPWIEGLAFVGFLAMVAFFVYSEFFQKKKEH